MKIEHEAGHKFYADIKGGEQAVLEYSRRGDVLDFYHTFVPPSQRGKGLAAKLVLAGFKYAQDENLKVIPTCPFIANDFLSRFPQYQTLIVKP